ncbi:MAG: response regulator [candidate division NC10 bacterium]|nr:response regulator [candidate division NC10 bacterium]
MDAEFRKAAAELALTLGATLKADEVLSLTCSETARLFHVQGTYLWLMDEERGELVGAAAYGHKAELFKGLRVPIAAQDSVAAAVAREGRSRVIHDVPSSTIAQAFLAKTFDGGSLLGVPLLAREKVTGVLLLNDLQPSRRFSAGDIHGAEVIAGQAALAIENARLYGEVLAHAEVLEQRVIERTRELEEASRHKSEFLAHMSHELRTPLNAIIGFAQLLEQGHGGALGPKHRRYVDNIHRSGKHLLTLINDILDLAKVEAGRMELHLEDLSLPQLVDETLAVVKGMAASRDVKLQLALDAEISRVPADPVRLKQILFNLLSNAVKFTPPGGVVTLRTSVSSDGEEVLFAVADTGIGIKPEDLKRLFRPFEQIARGEGREFGGTGLGLSLTKHLVELHGGRLWAESAGPGQGATFTLALPRQTAAPKPRVLLVDDTAKDRELVCDYLQAAGFEVEEAADGLQALELISRARPDLLVLDLVMPRMSGQELLQQLRARAETATLPVIVISGTEGMTEEERLALGVTAFLSKPFSPAVLLHTITGIVAEPSIR